jgi:hypothetical protein
MLLSITGRANGRTSNQELTMTRTIRMLLATTALAFSLSAPNPAQAEFKSVGLHFPDNKSGTLWVESFRDDEDPTKTFIIIMFKDGTSTVIHDIDVNPNPDEGGVGKGDIESRIALAKQGGGGKWIEERAFWDSPLGRHLAGKGKGPGPVINPGDDDVGGGPGDPSLGKEKLGGEALIIDHTGQLGSGKGGGFQPNSGSAGEQLKKPGGPGGSGKKKKGNGDDDNKGSSGPPPGTYFGPADLVDPLGPWVGKRAAKAAKGNDGKTKLYPGAATKRGAVPVAQAAPSHAKPKSSPMAAGLLDKNAGFASQGPATMGASMGPPMGAAMGTRVR